MLLIVGLGNPGSEHAGNRHNVGFMIADAIYRRHGFGPWRRRFRGEVAEGTLGGAKVLLLKPLTYMNESGRSVGEAANFFKIDPADIVVIHDEVDLPPGKLRMKDGGGTAGHNGLRSIGGAIGPAFRRMRIGVGHPGVKEMVPIHVLHDFAKSDRIWLEPLVEAIADSAPELATGKDSTFANRVHEAIAPEKPAAKEKKAKPVKELPKKPESDPEPTAPAMKKSEPRAEGSLARGIKRLFGSRE